VSSATAAAESETDRSPLMMASPSSTAAASRGLDAPPTDHHRGGGPLPRGYRTMYSSSPVPPPEPNDAEYLSRQWARVSLGDPEGDTVDDSDASHMIVD
jgi:hypothetical protein